MNSQVHELKLMNSKFMNLTNFMNLAISCSWIVHELFMNKCSWTAHELFKNHSWTVHDHFTGVSGLWIHQFDNHFLAGVLYKSDTEKQFHGYNMYKLKNVFEKI